MKPEDKLIFWMVVQTIGAIIRVKIFRRINKLVFMAGQLDDTLNTIGREYSKAADETDDAFREEDRKYRKGRQC